MSNKHIKNINKLNENTSIEWQSWHANMSVLSGIFLIPLNWKTVSTVGTEMCKSSRYRNVYQCTNVNQLTQFIREMLVSQKTDCVGIYIVSMCTYTIYT